MRRWAPACAMVVLIGACSPRANTPAPQRSSAVALRPDRLDPARIGRIRAHLPAGYEVGITDGGGAPVGFWGFRGDWTADPPECAALGAGAAADVRVVSGSGPGGIVHVAVAPHSARAPDPGVWARCGDWSVRNQHSVATVTAIESPPIDGAHTAGMTVSIRTVVESETATDATAYTYLAYLADQSVSVTVVTDPGATTPPLTPEFAAALLVASVAELRA